MLDRGIAVVFLALASTSFGAGAREPTRGRARTLARRTIGGVDSTSVLELVGRDGNAGAGAREWAAYEPITGPL